MRGGGYKRSLSYIALLHALVGGAMGLFSCEKKPATGPLISQGNTAAVKIADPNHPKPRTEDRLAEREGMVSHIKGFYGQVDDKTLEAMRNVPRHWFVTEGRQRQAYIDSPLPIGHGQTISQPFMVAYMTSVLGLDADSKVLEIGTGSGYQAAVLNEFTPHVYTIEIVEPLAKRTIEILREKGYSKINVKIGDGYKGWADHAPFDAIIVTCAPDHIPEPLIDQLKVGGKIVIPVGGQWSGQTLVLVTKDSKGKLERKSLMPVRFVPLTREE